MNYSPLRYPGGKSKIAPLIRTIMQTSNNTHTTYIEPFAGGSGVALNLLLEGYVNHIVINDYFLCFNFVEDPKFNPTFR